MLKSLFNTTNRPWGMFKVILESEFFWVKILQIKPKSRTSLQSHKNRTEQWTVIKGKALAEVINRQGQIVQVWLKPGGRFEIHPNTIHRITNESETTALIILEHAFGKPDENDITRHQDDYGRVPTSKSSNHSKA